MKLPLHERKWMVVRIIDLQQKYLFGAKERHPEVRAIIDVLKPLMDEATEDFVRADWLEVIANILVTSQRKARAEHEQVDK